MRYKKGHTITKLALNVGNVMIPRNVPKDFHFDDDGYFYKEEEEEEEKPYAIGHMKITKYVKNIFKVDRKLFFLYIIKDTLENQIHVSWS